MPSFRGIESAVVRWAGVVLVVVGVVVVYLRFPTRPPEDWMAIRSFQLDRDECRALRAARSTSELAIAPEDEPLSVGEVAAKLNLELALVCRANGLAADCARQALTAGAPPLVLPLYRDPSHAPPPAEPR